jgi:integrase/recombinase XerD
MTNDKNPKTQQLPLFPIEQESIGEGGTSRVHLTPNASLDQALGAFEKHMQDRGFTENTQQAFRLDLELFSDYIGAGKSIGDIGTGTLNAFLKWMENGRGVPCSPKTLERRITTLKVFFGWLAEEAFIPRDVAAPLIHQAVSAPLPDTLSKEQIAELLHVTRKIYQGDEDHKPDARPHLLVTLILNTGIKKSECVNIHLNHLDLADPKHPAVWIRYKSARRRHKERRIPLPASWSKFLEAYLEQYPTNDYLFPWTARNLEYVLTGVAEEAGISRVSFEILRWTCAVRDHVEGMEPDALRRKLGLSEISWYEVEHRLELLAQQRKFQS